MPLLPCALSMPPLIEGEPPHCQGDAVVHENHKKPRENGDDAQTNGCQVGISKAGGSVSIRHLQKPALGTVDSAQAAADIKS